METVVKEVKPILNIDELAETFGISRRTVYRELDAGMPFITVGKYKRFVYAEVLEYFKRK